jgi:sterol desaturase/sphingolipid hydroxylase (fatty acid hydroxylase superfamily)
VELLASPVLIAQTSDLVTAISRFRQLLRSDLESPEVERRFGKGWISGVAALVLAISGLFLVIGLLYPALLTVDKTRAFYQTSAFHLILLIVLTAAFVLAVISLVLRQNKILGFTALFLVVLATTLGGANAHAQMAAGSPVYLGLDWFVLNVIFTGVLFIPLQLLFPRYPKQELFRYEWREDLFYYFVSSMCVQMLTFISLWPALHLATATHWNALRAAISSQWLWLQFIEIMFLTDLAQYWVHRAFHRIPWLWNFHAVHHSAQVMDWMSGARMHFMEIIVLRAFTVVPMFILGYSQVALSFYIFYVYLHSTFIHANFGWNFSRIGRYIATPRFHHWHHGIEKEAVDVNFAIHFPILDRVFGTYHLPKDGWPQGYGIAGHPVPKGYWNQFLYPFRKRSTTSAS